jgi:energy-coupling factor transporter transmembrane protein EcfT
MILALRWFGLPFGPTVVLVIAFRFVPSLLALARNVKDAHALRSAPSNGARAFARMLQVLTSIIVSTVRQVPALAMALESRGFGRTNPRTAYRLLPSGRMLLRSFLAALLVSAVLVLPLILPVLLSSPR